MMMMDGAHEGVERPVLAFAEGPLGDSARCVTHVDVGHRCPPAWAKMAEVVGKPRREDGRIRGD